ncbi:MAG: hypothetical protein LBD49_00120 [Oscillospiraceae bacterium]|jgi:cyclic beta-1,2-glucan synthetase|nr:hypothetical protein [Oscillospiraceae bacterium]
MSHISEAAEEAASRLPRLKNISARRDAARALRLLKRAEKAAARGDGDMPPEALEWRRDDLYMAKREGERASRDFMGCGRLPRAPGGHETRVSAAARDLLVRAASGFVGAEAAGEYLSAFTSARELTERELGAFPAALTLAVIAELARARDLKGAASERRVSELFKSLRAVGASDFSETLEQASRVERVLRRDPAGVYADMSPSSRAGYRAEIARRAEKTKAGEEETALDALRRAEESGVHIGEFIVPEPGARRGAAYALAVIFISLLSALAFGENRFFALNFIIISEIVKRIIDGVISETAVHRPLPRLELRDGIPPEARTLAVMSVLLASPRAAEDAARKLEQCKIRNRDAGNNLVFGLLADLPEARDADAPGDAELKRAARSAIDALNKRSGGGFFLFLRERASCPRDRVFRGWERKRGAILQLLRALRGGGDIKMPEGYAERLGNVRYVIALDEDTSLAAGAARELAGTMMHPQNRAVVDPETRVVTRGHGILQPRVVNRLRPSARTMFARAFSGGGGHDAYGGARGELYQTVSGKSAYIGKGIIDVDAYLTCLDGRFPQNHVLSHDLLEGAYLRCAFAGETELSDGFPTSAAPYYERLHRWTRGDWQNAPWLFRRVRAESGGRERNPIGAIDKWMIFDNLRRSLLPPCAFALIAAGMINPRFLPEAGAAALSLVSGHALSALCAPFRGRLALRRRFSFVPESFAGRLVSSLARLVLLPMEASACARAAAVAVFRMAVTKRNMLQWVTAATSEKRRRSSVAECLRLALPGLVTALAALFFSPGTPISALALVWLLAPAAAAHMGRRGKKPAPSGAEREYLLKSAGCAYRYFEDFLTPEDNFLPPDNYQPTRPGALARRTSPTNIGFALLAPAAALELGLTGKDEALNVIRRALVSTASLETWHGHLYNRYDISSAAPSERFVSTVDSGNFAACLIALRESLLEYGDADSARLADAIYRAMDFAPLYDERRKLFRIGFDAGGGGATENVYDLISSEAMLTSCLAAARGDVPAGHWRALSRAAVRVGAYRGIVSWTGTMFEYLMPMLFLPYPRHSLLRESAAVCVRAHKKAARGGDPWGRSESAYRETDSSGNFLYKAHGAPALALKRGMERNAAAAPYASFLALEIDPRGALANLKRFEKLGAFGEYGFRDAVDFTRPRAGGSPSPVDTYMAHHLGMSLVATANYLKDGVFRRRFMRCREMGAFAELLEERVPAHLR